MNKKQPLLSICIPTYNRKYVLEQSLQTIVLSNGFDESIEIAISDNNSDDGTEELIKDYQKKYPNNFIYQKNIPACSADENFIRAMNLGNGKFLKLNNDYCSFAPDTLIYLINLVKKHKNKKTLLIFSDGHLHDKKRNQQEIIYGHGLDDLIGMVSYWTTWISIYGYWKEDFEKLPNKDRYSHLHLNIIDWIMRSVNQRKNFVVYTKKLFIPIELKKKSGWYSLFEVFLNNYYFILSEYIKDGDISEKTIRKDKKRIFPFICMWVKDFFVLKNKNLSFEINNAWKIIFKHYKNYYKLYIFIVKFFVFKILFFLGIYDTIKNIKKKIVDYFQ